ncbi:hypothetical protein PAHAL_4G278700 [Panicum hallii]|uniref:Signal recognition particle 9 kDa protein n=1 Tax=Panicum hallii TaxID=206008 RepID=A0A2T8JE60_9POAL|nr:hypothetical protein PAHAL_4G278700 [Panicum hallii]
MRHPKAQAAALLQSNLPFVKEKEKKIPSARTPPHATSAGPVLVLPDSPSPSSTRQFPPARLAGVLSVRGQPPLRRRPLRHPHPHPGVLCCLFNTQSKSYLNRDGLFSPVGAPPQIRPRHPHTAPAPNPSLAAAAMVYVDSWDEFVERSVQLFRADPSATRYVMKYRHCEGKLVLKVTDDRECLKFKTDQAQDAKKMEKLNNIFFALMTRGPDADISEVSGKEQAEQQQSKKGRGRRQ